MTAVTAVGGGGGQRCDAYEWWSGPCAPLPMASRAEAASAPVRYVLAREHARSAQWPRASSAAIDDACIYMCHSYQIRQYTTTYYNIL